jgi:hypothetical protein
MTNNNPIYIKLTDIPATKTRKGLIKKILTSKGVLTYTDEQCTSLQCAKKDAFRSISELHIIVKTRFKFTSLSSIMKIIKEIIDEEKCVSIVYCLTINKVVLMYREAIPKQYITDYSRNRYYYIKGVDGMSLQDYEAIINKL